MGAPDGTWSKTYNGFKQNLVAVVMASLDETELLQNAFELYGCDFMLDEHYNPILIEINSTPDLSPSTEITARICPMVLKDCIRVVVDLPKNPTAATGLFELAFEVNYSINKGADGKPLELNGKQMTLFENMPRMRNSPRTRLLRKILNNVKTTSRKVEKVKEAQVKNVKAGTVKISKKKVRDNLKNFAKTKLKKYLLKPIILRENEIIYKIFIENGCLSWKFKHIFGSAIIAELGSQGHSESDNS